MAKLVVLSGVPGSGKSYFSKALMRRKGGHVYIVSSDALRTIICGKQSDLSEDELVWQMYYELAKVYSIDKNGIVVLDSTNITSYYRVDLTKELKSYFDEIDLVMFNLNRETVLNQNLDRDFPIPDSVLDDFITRFELPTEKDKNHFDKIFVIDSRDIVTAVNGII